MDTYTPDAVFAGAAILFLLVGLFFYAVGSGRNISVRKKDRKALAAIKALTDAQMAESDEQRMRNAYNLLTHGSGSAESMQWLDTLAYQYRQGVSLNKLERLYRKSNQQNYPAAREWRLMRDALLYVTAQEKESNGRLE